MLMDLLELTLPTVAENLALDEALLEGVDSDTDSPEVLRLWELDFPAVIVGRASRIQEEVDVEYCRKCQVPVHRRCSGGAAVVVGQGCLMYALVLSLEARPALRTVDRAHQFVLGQLATALRRLRLPVQVSGISDLTMNNRKFSGNSLRCRRNALLYHGTLLYEGSIPLISRCLQAPPRQPEYRASRSHDRFLINLDTKANHLRRVLIDGWECQRTLDNWPRHRTEQLVRQRYALDQWNLQR